MECPLKNIFNFFFVSLRIKNFKITYKASFNIKITFFKLNFEITLITFKLIKYRFN